MADLQVSADFERQLLEKLHDAITHSLLGDRRRLLAGKTITAGQPLELRQVATGVPKSIALTATLQEHGQTALHTKDELVRYDLQLQATAHIPMKDLNRYRDDVEAEKKHPFPKVEATFGELDRVADFASSLAADDAVPRLDQEAVRVVSRVLPDGGKGDSDLNFRADFDKGTFRHSVGRRSGHDAPEGQEKGEAVFFKTSRVSLFFARETLPEVLSNIKERLAELGPAEGTSIRPDAAQIVAEPAGILRRWRR